MQKVEEGALSENAEHNALRQDNKPVEKIEPI